MSNLANNEVALIQSAINATKVNSINWERDVARGFNCFYCLIAKNQKFLADKYYSYSGSETKECFNFTVLSADEKVIIELVRCYEPESSEYQLLKSLYESIEVQYKAKIDETLSPILTEIASSLQQ